MNSVTAVLLALGLILVVLLVVWLVLRSRTSDAPRGSAAYGPAPDDQEPAPSVVDLMPSRHGHDSAAADVATNEARPDDGPGAEHGTSTAEPIDEADATVAEEFVDPGLSELEAEAVDEAEPGDDTADGARSDAPPQTPTEAFGSADVSGDLSGHEATTRETSALDDEDADSTPLFRSIREELLGSTPPEESPDEESAAEAEDPTVEVSLAEEVVSEQPEVEQSWSHERRGWDEQAHAENQGAVEAGAVGIGSVGPAAEEEKVLETNEETIGDVVHVEPDVMMGEHPPIRRISELHEVVDGGFGIGSAATLDDGAQPLGHPIKATRDTKTYQDLHSIGYDETEPDVWFLDAGFAERAGFRRAE
ncbi:MAG: hypothetical protein ABR500_10245 [Dermatophilaceae bacterium]|nr:hypothetical protein [Intrasporangiaceae bacterium]